MEACKKKRLKRKKLKTIAALTAAGCFLTLVPTQAQVSWKQEAGAQNTQGDKHETGKSDHTAEAPVYGAIGNLDGAFGMDIDGDGTVDVTVPEGDLIEVGVTPSVSVNLHVKPTGTGDDVTVQTVSAEGTIQNKNQHNRLKVSLETLEPGDSNAQQVKVTDELDQNAANGLSLSIYAKESIGNAFAEEGEALGKGEVSLANTAQTPPVPVTLGTLSKKGESLPYGIYLFRGECRSAFLEKYEDQAITYKAVYKFTIQN